MTIISKKPVRALTLREIGFQHLIQEVDGQTKLETPLDSSELDATDPILKAAQTAIGMGYAGIILSGSPGTGKTWYAQQLAVAFSGRWDAVRFVQFHPSYQYEDFVFGFAPNKEGGFELHVKEFARICRDAASDPSVTYVLVIDEISRTDVIRIFGEALTYIETDKRDQPFETASGEELTVPRNLILIGTMNPWDKGVEELDVALQRRFAEIELEPSAKILEHLLSAKGAEDRFLESMITFFRQIQELPLDTVRLGHAYFLNCIDVESATWVWTFRLRPTFRRACRHEPNLYETIEKLWYETIRLQESEAD